MTLLKFHQFYSAKKYQGIRINLENHSSPTENSKKIISLNRKHLKKKQKNKEENFEIFHKIFVESLR